jgi:creatinine amidohydrolase
MVAMTHPLPTAGPRRLKELTPAQAAAILAADPRLILPVGTCEQHGPHLPLGCDTIIVERLADDLSSRFGVLRAPAVEYGVNSEAEKGFTGSNAGSSAVRKKTLHRMLNDLLASWESTGVEEFILITAHGHDPHQEALATVVTSSARVRVVDAFAVNVTDLLDGQREPMHGDEVDTSIMLHLAPDLVHMEAARDYMISREDLRRYRRGWLRVPRGSAGSIGRPSLATAEKGRRIYERILERIAQRVFVAPPVEV